MIVPGLLAAGYAGGLGRFFLPGDAGKALTGGLAKRSRPARVRAPGHDAVSGRIPGDRGPPGPLIPARFSPHPVTPWRLQPPPARQAPWRQPGRRAPRSWPGTSSCRSSRSFSSSWPCRSWLRPARSRARSATCPSSRVKSPAQRRRIPERRPDLPRSRRSPGPGPPPPPCGAAGLLRSWAGPVLPVPSAAASSAGPYRLLFPVRCQWRRAGPASTMMPAGGR